MADHEDHREDILNDEDLRSRRSSGSRPRRLTRSEESADGGETVLERGGGTFANPNVTSREIAINGVDPNHQGYVALQRYFTEQYSQFDMFDVGNFEQVLSPNGTIYYRVDYGKSGADIDGGRTETYFSFQGGSKIHEGSTLIVEPVNKPNLFRLVGETPPEPADLLAEALDKLPVDLVNGLETISTSRAKWRADATSPWYEKPFPKGGSQNYGETGWRAGRDALERQRIAQAMVFLDGVSWTEERTIEGGTVEEVEFTIPTADIVYSLGKFPGLVDLVERGTIGKKQAIEYYKNIEALTDPKHNLSTAPDAAERNADPFMGDGPDIPKPTPAQQAAIDDVNERGTADPGLDGGGGGTRRIYTPPDEREVADGIRGMLATQVGFAVDSRVNDLTRLFMSEDRRAFDNPKIGLSAQASVQERIRGSEDYKRIHKLRPDYVNENQWVSEMQQRALSAGVGTDFAQQFSVDQATVGADFGSVGRAASTQQFLEQGRAEGEFFDNIRGTVKNMFTGVS